MRIVTVEHLETLYQLLLDRQVINADLGNALVQSLNDIDNTNVVVAPPEVVDAWGALRGDIQGLQNYIEEELELRAMSALCAMAARQWKVARDRIIKVEGKESVPQFLTYLPVRVLGVALKSLGSIGMAGVGSILFEAISGVDEILSPQNAGAAVKDFQLGMLSVIPEYLTQAKTFNEFFSGKPRGKANEVLMDPVDYFLFLKGEFELQATKMSEWQNSLRNPAIQQAEKITIQNKIRATRDALRQKNEFLKYIPKMRQFETGPNIPQPSAQEVQDALDTYDEQWAAVEDYVAVLMRRLAWTHYCRSVWSDWTWNYTIRPNRQYREGNGENAAAWQNEDPREWPSLAWKQDKFWPTNWAIIVNDFRGPEHDSDHPLHTLFNPDNAALAIQKAGQLEQRQSHVSLAAVHCCQIKRPGRRAGQPLNRDSKIDALEYVSQHWPPPQGVDQVPPRTIFFDPYNERALARFKSVPVPPEAKIALVAFTDKNATFFPSGTKGRIDRAYQKNDKGIPKILAANTRSIGVDVIIQKNVRKRSAVSDSVVVSLYRYQDPNANPPAVIAWGAEDRVIDQGVAQMESVKIPVSDLKPVIRRNAPLQAGLYALVLERSLQPGASPVPVERVAWHFWVV